MSEEYGYQRSGKKCKEKFENLYKYYKKTKEGKAGGRQDGKHYRFFRQLEAICGESTAKNTATSSANYQPPLMTFTDGEVLHHNIKYSSKGLSLSNNSSDHQFETSSSENNDDKDLSAITYMMKQKQVDQIDHQRDSGRMRMKKSLRVEVEEIVDSHMRKIIETQDAWMEKMMSVVEHREQEMVYKEQERKRDSSRFDQEVHQLWAEERAWIAERDSALMEVVKKHLGKEPTTDHHDEPMVEEYEEEPQAKRTRARTMVGGQNWRTQI